MAIETRGLSLDEFTKATPPGWKPWLTSYPLRLYEEKLELWLNQCDLDVDAGEEARLLKERSAELDGVVLVRDGFGSVARLPVARAEVAERADVLLLRKDGYRTCGEHLPLAPNDGGDPFLWVLGVSMHGAGPEGECHIGPTGPRHR